jgi:hypothetical protein
MATSSDDGSGDEISEVEDEASLLADECCEHTVNGEDIQRAVASVQHVRDDTRKLRRRNLRT